MLILNHRRRSPHFVLARVTCKFDPVYMRKMRCGPTEAAMKRDADIAAEYERTNWQSVTASAASRVGDEETEVHRRRRDWARRDSFRSTNVLDVRT